MQEHKTDIICIQETGGHEDEEILIHNHLLLLHGIPLDTEKIARGGVGICLSPAAQTAWKNAGQPNPIRMGKIAHTARVMGITLLYKNHKGKNNLIFVINCYIPCSSWSDKDFTETLKQLHQIIRMKPKGATPIIFGDFNAQVGTYTDPSQHQTDTCNILCRHGNYRINDRGLLLLDFLHENGFLSRSLSSGKKVMTHGCLHKGQLINSTTSYYRRKREKCAKTCKG